MSGQCYACGSEFGFFKKEHGCKNCGFAFCSNCLTKKIAVPKLDNSKHHVCNKCYNVLTGKVPAEEKRKMSPPEAYKKRVAALDQKESHGAVKGASAPAKKPNPKYAGLGKKDREIAERLEKLKEKPNEQKVTDTDLNERLARLKGEDPAVRTAPTKPFYQPPDRRTQVEQIDDLLEEIANEVEIDSHQPDPATYVENRLARLRDAENQTPNNLDKDSPTLPKTYVKNIDLGGASNKDVAGSGQDSDVDAVEVQGLMERAAAQMEADAQKALEGLKKDKQLMERLAEIKQRQKSTEGKTDAESVESNVDNTQEEDEDSENEEVAAQRIIQQYLEEAKLDERVGEDFVASGSESSLSSQKKNNSGASKVKSGKANGRSKEESNSNSKTEDADSDYEDPNELPYCCICTEDAVVRCIDCDMDLYCNVCFTKGHKELGLSDHRSVPYKAPKGYR